MFRATDPRASMLSKHHRVQADCAAGLTSLISQIVARGWDRLVLIVERDAGRPNPWVNGEGLLPYEAQGIADAVKATSIAPPTSDRIITCSSRWAKARYETVAAYLGRRRLEPGTCLLQCGADGVSGTYSAITNSGLRVGYDVAVATTNPTPPWEYVLPLASHCSELHEFSSRWLVDTVIEMVEAKPGSVRRRRIHAATSEHRITLTESTRRRE